MSERQAANSPHQSSPRTRGITYIFLDMIVHNLNNFAKVEQAHKRHCILGWARRWW
jgi:hypothetical protein